MSENINPQFSSEDWAELKRLRQTFLSENFSNQRDYWGSSKLLKLYHQSFGQRIGWKWDAVLEELKNRAVFQEPTPRLVIDYGCGTGIAAHKIAKHLGSDVISAVYFGDKSAQAVQFAVQNFKESYPTISTQPLNLENLPTEKWILCLSHIINEISEEDLRDLISLIGKSEMVIWVEPGTSSTSRKLVELREVVRDKMDVLAPCTHQQRCGMLSPENNRHWCHYFAVPPNEVFQSDFWGQFSRQLNIDLRALPTSFLVLKSRQTKFSMPSQETRVVGRPRFYKGNGKFLVCNSDAVREVTLLERNYKDLFKEFKKSLFFKVIPLETK